MSCAAGWIIRIGSIATILLLGTPAKAVSLIDNKLPTAWSQSVSEFVQNYVKIYSTYDKRRQEEEKQKIIPQLEQKLLAIAMGSEVLATALDDTSRGHENPRRLALESTRIRRSVEALISMIQAIDPNWRGARPSIDFLNALDQLQKGNFDFVDGRIWELSSGRDMKPEETRQIALAFRLEAQQLIEIVKRLIVGTDTY